MATTRSRPLFGDASSSRSPAPMHRSFRCCAVSAFKNRGVQPLLDAVVDYLPSPEDVPPIVGLDPNADSDAVPTERAAHDDAPFAALAFKVMTDAYVGQLTFIRVYSGVMKSGATIYNPIRQRSERIGTPAKDARE